MAEKVTKKYVDLTGLRRYHERQQNDLEERDYQSETDVKAALRYHHEHTAKETFVEKQAGKGLSSNDFTNALKNKLENLENVVPDGLTDAQVEKLNNAVTTSELEEMGFQTRSNVETLVAAMGYQTASDVRTIVATSQYVRRKLVTSADDIDPEAEDADQYIYLVPLYTNENTVYSEWIVVDGEAVMVGTGFTDLDDYWSKNELEILSTADIDALISGNVPSV